MPRSTPNVSYTVWAMDSGLGPPRWFSKCNLSGVVGWRSLLLLKSPWGSQVFGIRLLGFVPSALTRRTNGEHHEAAVGKGPAAGST